ncbi:MAG: hypothetical protein ACOYBR_09555 [Fluviibacter sp.]
MKYQNPHVIAQRRALVEALDLTKLRAGILADELCDRIGQRWFELGESEYRYARIWADDIDAALAVAVDGVDPSNYPREDDEPLTTRWVIVDAVDITNRDHASARVTLAPEVPPCVDGREHEWIDTGIVRGHGGGVITIDECPHCHTRRVFDTWASDGGCQGLDAVTFEGHEHA